MAHRERFACVVRLEDGKVCRYEVVAGDMLDAVGEVLRKVGCGKPWRLKAVRGSEVEVCTKCGRLKLSVVSLGEVEVSFVGGSL